VPPNLRASLTAFSIGLAVEGAGAVYSTATHSVNLPGGQWLLYLGGLFTLIGLIFLYLGRHEWGELHHRRVRHAHRVFGLVLLSAAIGGGLVAAYVYLAPAAAAPASLAIVAAATVGIVLVGSYVTYLLVVFHLVSWPGRIAAVGALIWTAFVALLLAEAVQAQFPEYLAFLRHQGSLSSADVTPLTTPLSLLFVAYFLLLVAYADAHQRVARGLDPPAPVPAS
jgi:hypothetical protein